MAEKGDQHGAGEARQRAKVLTCSDGVVHGTREDRSGAAPADLLITTGSEAVARRVPADGTDTAAAALPDISAASAALVLSTCAPALAPPHHTPHAPPPAHARHAP